MEKKRWKMLSCDELRGNYRFLMNYFENGIDNTEKNISHCILFYGSDLQSQYNLALEISRMLNCSESHATNCECLNCRWIKENKHPAIQTVTRWDSKAINKQSKCQNISIDIARKIKCDLLVNSDYHRIMIFCDKDSEEDENIRGLNHINFQDDTANALLKTFEEPPQNTTFFFLTKDKDDMISTVVSRAQSFYVPSLQKELFDYKLVKDVMDGYLELERSEVLDFNDSILNLTKDNNPEEIFTQMQNHIGQTMKANLNNTPLKLKLIKDLNSIEKAKKELRLNMNIQTIVETMCFEMIL